VPVQVGGNIGQPLISLVESSLDEGWTVVELSSFQLETIRDFHPEVAVVLMSRRITWIDMNLSWITPPPNIESL